MTLTGTQTSRFSLRWFPRRNDTLPVALSGKQTLWQSAKSMALSSWNGATTKRNTNSFKSMEPPTDREILVEMEAPVDYMVDDPIN
jgi:hypothetical protein